MKKILTVSLFAMMAVSAANADIASTAYVETAKTAAISTAASDATSKANAAKEAAISAAASDATSKANAAKEAAIAAIPAVDSTLNENSNNAATSKAIATYVSSRLEVLNGEQEAINTSIGELKTDIAAINHKDTGILALAKADATSKANAAQSAAESKVTALQNGAVKTNTDNITAMDKAYKDADTAIKNTIGTVDEGKTVVEMISEAQTNATYDDTEVRGLITTNKNNISAMDTAYKAADTALGNRLTTAEGDIDDLQTGKADKATTLAGYGITDAMTATAIGTAISTAKSEAVEAAKTAGDTAYDSKGSAAAAQTAAVNAAKTAADATYQVKSSALSVGAANGAWTDLTKAAGYSATGTHSLVLKNGTIQWEAVSY